MINKNVIGNDVVFTMVSEDGSETKQAEVKYTLKTVKKGTFATATFSKDVDINTEYDCAYSLLDNTVPEGVYCIVIGNKPTDKNFDIIKDAATRLGYVETKGKLIKSIK